MYAQSAGPRREFRRLVMNVAGSSSEAGRVNPGAIPDESKDEDDTQTDPSVARAQQVAGQKPAVVALPGVANLMAPMSYR